MEAVIVLSFDTLNLILIPMCRSHSSVSKHYSCRLKHLFLITDRMLRNLSLGEPGFLVLILPNWTRWRIQSRKTLPLYRQSSLQTLLCGENTPLLLSASFSASWGYC